MSDKNALTSSGLGGNPTKSKYTRRIRVLRSASWEYDSPFASSFVSRNRSMGFIWPPDDRTRGIGGRSSGFNDHHKSFVAASLRMKMNETKRSTWSNETMDIFLRAPLM